MIPEDLHYSETHEWAKIEGGVVTMGITHHAQEELTDIVYVGLPDEGAIIALNEAIIVMESVKSVEDVYSPVAGEVIEVNNDLVNHPEYVNDSPYELGWLVKIKAVKPVLSHLMDAAAYKAYIEGKS